MRTIPAGEVDAWLRAGGTVVAASDRAARTIRSAYHRVRRAEGLTAWTAPEVLDWNAFVRREWDCRASDGRLILNGKQEQSLWSQIIAGSTHTEGWLDGPRRRLADLAAEAHELLCSYAPDLLHPAARRDWQQDAGAFSAWLSALDDTCARNGYLSAGRLPLELLSVFKDEHDQRPPLLLAGFDRLLPIQQRFLEAWGESRLIEPGQSANDVRSYVAPDERLQLAACALWCRQRLAAHAEARLLVVVPDPNQNRGEIERAFLKDEHAGQKRQFEFSLGVPLGQVGIVRAALLVLRWLDGAIQEHDLDWLLASGFTAASPEETAALEAYMRTLRRRGLERVSWTLDAFLRQPAATASNTVEWCRRMRGAQQQLKNAAARPQSPLDWSTVAVQLLGATGWPGARETTGAEFQAASRWQQSLDLCGSLGFDGRRLSWTEFVAELETTAAEMLFAEESQDAPIVIAGPAESAGLTADGIWFLGADEDSWPASGSTHPLIPIDVQRKAGMPHASPKVDWALAESITARLLASAPQICFSHARQKEDVETRSSRLVVLRAGEPLPMPAGLTPEAVPQPLTVAFKDTAALALPTVATRRNTPQLNLFDDAGTKREPVQIHEVPGGSMVLTSQSQCAFKAFATARLGAQGWQPAQPGLTPSQRGKLLHAVLHSVWSETPPGIRTWNQLHTLGEDLQSFVEGRVRRVLEEGTPAAAREQMPARYLELEGERLARLVTEWLRYERERVPFEVMGTETASAVAVAGLTLKLRLDRVDRLTDGSLLVIDYKTGNVSPTSWDLPRPDDVQLPLYAEFALPRGEELGGLAFARVRPGDMCFAGKIAAPQETLDHDLKGSSGLVRNKLTATERADWKREIEQLAHDFIAGRADVNPRDDPNTCELCGLYSLCRIREREDRLESEDEEMQAEGPDE